jgi:hypothetical protein
VILLAQVALGVTVGPTESLQARVDAADDGIELELETGVYTEPLVVAGKRVVIRPVEGADAVLGGAVVADESQLRVEGDGVLVVEGVDIVPTNRPAVVVADGFLELRGLEVEMLGSGRLVRVDRGEALIEDVTLTGGTAGQGGQVRVGTQARATLRRVVSSGGRAVAGGAAWVTGTLVATDSSFTAHEATDGGALWCAGTCELRGGTLSDNQATAAGGAAVVRAGGTLQLLGLTVERNVATEGGAVLARNASLDVSRTSFCRNAARAVGELGGSGGALLLDQVDGTLAFNRFLLNEARFGGGVHATVAPVLFSPSFIGNSALSGSAIFGEAVLRRALVGHQQGGVVFQPAAGGVVDVESALLFLNAAELHPTDALADRPTPLLRSFAPDLACARVDDLFLAGSELVLDAVGEPSGRPPSEFGAYARGGIDTGDEDGDGYPAAYDCNDRNPDVFPASRQKEDWYDGIDENCDGRSDFDRDDDGFDAQPFGTDCDDDDPRVFPGASDLDPLVDQNCNGFTEEAPPELRPAACAVGWWPRLPGFARRR